MALKQSRELLRDHRQRWREAQLLDLPSAYGVRIFSRTSEAANRRVLSGQKALKKMEGEVQIVQAQGTGSNQLIASSGINNPATYWRFNCLSVWYNAIVKNNPGSSDYADWLGPYVENDVFDDPSYPKFWLEEVAHENVPGQSRLRSI